MSDDNYVKFFRSAIKHRYFSNVNLWHFYQYCILKASRLGHEQLVGFQSVKLLPGEFVFGRSKASQETGLTEQTIRTCLKQLEADKKISVKSTNKFSIICVDKFNTWQDCYMPSNQQVTSKQPASNQQVTTNNKENKEKNKKKNATSKIPADFTFSEQHKLLAEGLNLQSQFEAFKDYHYSKGTTFKDWGLAFNNWLRNSKKFKQSDPQPTKRLAH